MRLLLRQFVHFQGVNGAWPCANLFTSRAERPIFIEMTSMSPLYLPVFQRPFGAFSMLLAARSMRHFVHFHAAYLQTATSKLAGAL